MAIKRSPLGRDPLEWIKVTKSDGTNAAEEGTAADRLTESAPPAEEKREEPKAAPAPAPPQAPPQTGFERLLGEAPKPAEAAPPQEAEKPAPQEPVAPRPEPSVFETPIVVTTYTPPAEPVAPKPEPEEPQAPPETEQAAETKPEEIPLFAKVEAAEKAKETVAPPPEEKPPVKTLGLEEVTPSEAKPSVMPEEGEPKVEVPVEALAKPAEAETMPRGGHSVNFMAPGVGATETVAAPAPPVEPKAEEPVEVSAPAALETPKAEEISTPAAAPAPSAVGAKPVEPAVEEPAEVERPERIHVGAVDLRVHRKQIPVPSPAALVKERPAEPQKGLSATHIFYICLALIVLLATLMITVRAVTKGEVSSLTRRIRALETKNQQAAPHTVPARLPNQP